MLILDLLEFTWQHTHFLVSSWASVLPLQSSLSSANLVSYFTGKIRASKRELLQALTFTTYPLTCSCLYSLLALSVCTRFHPHSPSQGPHSISFFQLSPLYLSYLHTKMLFHSGWCDSVDRVPACERKGHRFGSRSEYILGLQARSPVGGMWGATDQCFSPFLSPSLPLSLKISK